MTDRLEARPNWVGDLAESLRPRTGPSPRS